MKPKADSPIAQIGPEEVPKNEDTPPPKITPIPVVPEPKPPVPVVPEPKKPLEERIGEVRQFSGHGGEVRRVAWSPDGKRIVTGSWENSVRVFDAATLEVIQELKGHTKGVTDVTFDDRGNRVLSTAADGSVRLWLVSTGQEEASLDLKTNLHTAALSPNERLVAAAGSSDAVWLMDKGRLNAARRLPGHEQPVARLPSPGPATSY